MKNETENQDMKMKYKSGKSFWIMKGIKFFLLFVLFAAAMSYVVMHLWNWIVPVVFGAGIITYWQALGILVLSKILFGFGRSGHWGSHHSHHNWKERMGDRLRNMTPDERNRFREDWKRRCGDWKHYDWNDEQKPETEVKQ